jgi:polyisoprenoid-binding protein YceI
MDLSFSTIRTFAMKNVFLAVPMACIATVAVAAGVTSTDPKMVEQGTYTLDSSHVGVAASVSHLGFSNTVVRFDKVLGSLTYDPANPQNAKADITIDAASLNSGWAARDGHLKGKDFFNVEAFPSVQFKSAALTPTSNTTADLTGDLTLLGVTKPVTLKVEFKGVGKGFDPAPRIGFAGITTIKRSDFGMKASLPMVGDDATITIDAEFVKKP